MASGFKKSKPTWSNKRPKIYKSDRGKEDLDLSAINGKWHEIKIPNDPDDFPKSTEDSVIRARNEADGAIEDETIKFKEKMSSNSDYNWMRTIMSKGTSSDKIASYVLAIQDSPIYNIPLLENMVNLVKMGKKKDCFTVIDTLTELFIQDLIPKNWQKLRPFSCRPISLLDSLCNGKPSLRKKILIVWRFEDKLKEVFANFLSLVFEVASKDSVEKNRMHAISAFSQLLLNVAEKEDVILTSLVNKLGDPNQKVSSKVMFCLKQLLHEHPRMKTIVLEEMEKLIFRKNIGSKTQFYGLCFLSQVYLSEDDDELAKKLIRLYFSFFKACIKKGEIDSRLMGAILVGVKRAYPYSKLKIEDESMMENIETIHKVVHLGSFNISVRALSLLLLVMDCSRGVISNRFYTALYRKIIDPHLASSNLQGMFLSVCFNALKGDTEANRRKAFIKRLLEVCHYVPVPLACGILYMISEILRLNQDFFPLKFVNTSENVEHVNESDNDDYEYYADVKEEDEIKVNSEEEIQNAEKGNIKVEIPPTKDAKKSVGPPSWIHHAIPVDRESLSMRKLNNGYDSYQRNPLYAATSLCTFSELIRLSQHFHPTVSLFAQKLLQGDRIEYSGDPLQDFSLLRFLNRFAFKNPKKLKKSDKEKESFSWKKSYSPLGLKSLPIISESYLNEKEENIPVDEIFLYRYVHQRRKDKKDLKQEEKEGSDIESVGSDEFEEVIQKFIGGKKHVEIDDEVNFADGVEFDNDDDGSGSESQIKEKTKKKKKNLRKVKGQKRNLGDESGSDSGSDDDLSKVFVSAEEFAEILQETGSSGLDTAGGSGLSNKDNAAIKQLSWEAARDKWLKGGKKYSRKPSAFNHRKKKRAKI